MNRTLSIHGVLVPKLGLGTWQLSSAEATASVRHALEVGYRHIDTAQMYDNEEGVGRGIAASGVARDEVFLTTKVWRDRLDHDALVSSTDESLRRLGTDYVDLLLMHWPNDDVPLAETLGALAEVRDAGKARLIGVSNTPAGMLRRALDIEPTLANDQVEYHPYLAQDDVLGVVRENGLFLTAYSPIAQGGVTRGRHASGHRGGARRERGAGRAGVAPPAGPRRGDPQGDIPRSHRGQLRRIGAQPFGRRGRADRRPRQRPTPREPWLRARLGRLSRACLGWLAVSLAVGITLMASSRSRAC